MQQVNEYGGVTSNVLVGYVLFLDSCVDNLYEKPIIVGPHYQVKTWVHQISTSSSQKYLKFHVILVVMGIVIQLKSTCMKPHWHHLLLHLSS
jgi:hypothetical protein